MWKVLFCLLLLSLPLRAPCMSASESAELEVLIDQAEQIMQRQAAEIEEGKKQLQQLNMLLKASNNQIAKLQKSYKRCVTLSVVVGSAMAGIILYQSITK